MKVFFAGGGTGGHLYPGLAIARALVRLEPRAEPFFLGARRGIERDVLPTTGFPFELFDLHPLYRSSPWNNWRTLVGGAAAWRRVAALARTYQPVALVATGGYAAGVALGYASLHHVPVVIQEQNSSPGVTVRWFARRAAQIHLGFPEAAASLTPGPKTRVFDSGNPIDPPPAVRPDRDSALAAWGFVPSPLKTLLVFGGSQGSDALNQVVGTWIDGGGPERGGVRVIWSTGKAKYALYRRFESDIVKVRPYISPMADAYAAADFALCRAGAMTIAELAAWGIPAIFVPLPSAAADHQTANAKTITASGAAFLIPQHELTATILTGTIGRMLNSPSTLMGMRNSALQRARPDAADVIADKILALVGIR